MFSTVLVPTDLSPASDSIVACAASSLVPLGARSFILLHALGIRHLDAMAPSLAVSAEPRLAAQASALRQTGCAVDVVTASGVAHKEINRVARERRASLVLLGSQGAGLLSELRVGSVTLETLHRCEVPVLLARVTCDAAGDGPISCHALGRRLLHPTDFSDEGERAFSYVRALAARGVDEVTLLHVQDRKDRSRIQGRSEQQLAAFDEIDHARLERLAGDLRQVGVAHVHVEVAHGSPIQEILRSAAKAPNTLIVMGSQGLGFIPEVFLGSVSHAVARIAKAPVLLVPGRSLKAPRS